MCCQLDLKQGRMSLHGQMRPAAGSFSNLAYAQMWLLLNGLIRVSGTDRAVGSLSTNTEAKAGVDLFGGSNNNNNSSGKSSMIGMVLKNYCYSDVKMLSSLSFYVQHQLTQLMGVRTPSSSAGAGCCWRAWQPKTLSLTTR